VLRHGVPRPRVLEAVLAELPPGNLDSRTYSGQAARVMGMNNIFYRFAISARMKNTASMPARLRMQVIRTHGSDPVDFELCAWLFRPSTAAVCA